jgi:alkylation response protein AidB-like acyl-CoA dehydrogenase
MDFSWTEEQLALRAAVAEFAAQSLGDRVPEHEREEGEFRSLWQKCAEFGIQGLTVPTEYGGGGYDIMSAILLLEALGRSCSDQGLLFSLHAHMWAIQVPLLKFGTAEQKDRYFPGLCDGTLIGAHAMSEPGSGSDAFALHTRAERRGSSYVLSGSKTFVTNAPIADVFIVFGTLDRSRGLWGLTAFLVDRNTPGLTVGKKLEKMGLTTSPTAEVFLEGCVVPVGNRLGREGQGAAIFNHSMAWERAFILTSALGAMDRQLEQCLRYASERRQFGRRIGDFQLVAAKLADMKVRLETARLLLYKAAWEHAAGRGTGLEGAMAKLYISEAAVRSALDAIQIHGGYGYMREYEVERSLRDSVAGTLYSGTSEMLRLIIARGMGLSPS